MPVTTAIYKKLAATLFIAAFLSQLCGRYWLIADYYLHTEEYASHCINTYRPQMHCNGKCRLMQKMQQAEKEEKKQQKNCDRLIEIPVLEQLAWVTAGQFTPLNMPLTPLFREENIDVGYATSIFHPPGTLF